MLAVLAEVIDITSWRAVMPHAKKGWKPPKGLHIRRPWEPKPDPDKPRMRMGEFRKMLGAMAGAVKVAADGEEVNGGSASR